MGMSTNLSHLDKFVLSRHRTGTSRLNRRDIVCPSLCFECSFALTGFVSLANILDLPQEHGPHGSGGLCEQNRKQKISKSMILDCFCA